MPKTKSYTINDYYNFYIEKVEDNPLYKIDYATYRSIVSDYLKFISEQIIMKSREFKLPSRLGSIFVFKRMPARYEFKYLRVDFGATKEYGKAILHLNEHSDGFNYRFRWQKSDAYVKNQKMYEMIMTRHNKRLLARAIKEYRIDYIELKTHDK